MTSYLILMAKKTYNLNIIHTISQFLECSQLHCLLKFKYLILCSETNTPKIIQVFGHVSLYNVT